MSKNVSVDKVSSDSLMHSIKACDDDNRLWKEAMKEARSFLRQNLVVGDSSALIQYLHNYGM